MNGKFETLCVIGLGYIGLPTAATFAKSGLFVTGVDVNEYVVNTINSGKIHIVEPDLDEVVKEVVTNGKLKAALKPIKADAYILSVPTPFKEENYTPDLSYVEAATKAICPFLNKGSLVILESTSPVGTTEKIAEIITCYRKDLNVSLSDSEESDVFIAHCPERVLPGKVLYELINNDRIIGGITKKSTELAINLYKVFVKGACIATNARTAELAKLVENASRDLQIAFANELSILCDKMNINVWELIDLANRHPRVNILQPGCGVGGHCIAVDPWFIVNAYPNEAKLIQLARNINDSKPNYVISKVLDKASVGAKIACLGLAFKPDIDDLRESPALKIVHDLAKLDKFDLLVVEPNINSLPSILKDKVNVTLVTLEKALEEAELLVVLVKHSSFVGLKVTKPYLDFVNAFFSHE